MAAVSQRAVPERFPTQRQHPAWTSTLTRIALIAAGGMVILLPAWLPNRPSVPLERGVVEALQAILLGASAVIILGAGAHAGRYRPMCRMLGLVLIAAVMGELEEFLSGILGWNLPEVWLVAPLLLAALIIALRHRRTTVDFFSKIGHHAGSGLIAAALLINYVFNIVIGSPKFWKAALGASFTREIPVICKSYLELLACYLIFAGVFGLSLTLARRQESL